MMQLSRFLQVLSICGTVLALPAHAAAQNTTWHLAEGATTAFFEEEILIANPNAAAATVNMTFSRFNGTTVPFQIVVAATSRATVRVNDVVPNDAVSAVITSNVAIIVERSIYFPGAARNGGHNAVGVTAPALIWRLAEGSTDFFNPFILIANPSLTTDAQVRVTYLRADGGTPVVKTHTVTQNSRFTIWVNAMVPSSARRPSRPSSSRSTTSGSSSSGRCTGTAWTPATPPPR